MHKAVILFLFLLSISLFLLAGVNTTQSEVHPEGSLVSSSTSIDTSVHVVIYSTYSGSQYDIYVPVNSTGVSVYPVWHIQLYGKGSFSFIVNSTQVESGFSLGSFNLSYTFTGNQAVATLDFDGKYTFNDIITPELTDHNIQSVQVYSCYPGQAQYLTVQNGVSGALMYTHWVATMQSTQNVSYSIYVGGQSLASGYFVGTKDISFNVTGSSATVTIGIGKIVYRYPSEPISSVPVSKYYGPKPPALAYTASDLEYALARGFVAALFAVVVALLVVRKYALEKEKRSVVRI